MSGPLIPKWLALTALLLNKAGWLLTRWWFWLPVAAGYLWTRRGA